MAKRKQKQLMSSRQIEAIRICLAGTVCDFCSRPLIPVINREDGTVYTWLHQKQDANHCRSSIAILASVKEKPGRAQ